MGAMPASGYNAVRDRPSGLYEARWAELTPDGKWALRGKSFIDKTTAKNYAVAQAAKYQAIGAGTRDAEHDIEMVLGRFLSRPNVSAQTHEKNEYQFRRFMGRHNLTKMAQLTERLIDDEWNWQRREGLSLGYQNHILKLIMAFCVYSVAKGWLKKSPFPYEFTLPQSDRKPIRLSEDQFETIISIRAHQACVESDTWMRRWLILQRYTLTRVSTIFDLTPECFRSRGTEMRVNPLKHQKGVWSQITHPRALTVVQELLALTPSGERVFRHWKRLSTFREAFRVKAQILGLPAGLRPHDACKVTEVTALDAKGVSLGQIAAVSNTRATTLAKHYLNPDRDAAFARVRAIYAQTTSRPQDDRFMGSETHKTGQNRQPTDIENSPFIDGKTVDGRQNI